MRPRSSRPRPRRPRRSRSFAPQPAPPAQPPTHTTNPSVSASLDCSDYSPASGQVAIAAQVTGVEDGHAATFEFSRQPVRGYETRSVTVDRGYTEAIYSPDRAGPRSSYMLHVKLLVDGACAIRRVDRLGVAAVDRDRAGLVAADRLTRELETSPRGRPSTPVTCAAIATWPLAGL